MGSIERKLEDPNVVKEGVCYPKQLEGQRFAREKENESGNERHDPWGPESSFADLDVDPVEEEREGRARRGPGVLHPLLHPP